MGYSVAQQRKSACLASDAAGNVPGMYKKQRPSEEILFQSLDERAITGAVGSGAGPDGAGAVGRFTRACWFAALPG
jgi:hypothetical protein